MSNRLLYLVYFYYWDIKLFSIAHCIATVFPICNVSHNEAVLMIVSFALSFNFLVFEILSILFLNWAKFFFV